MSIEFIHPTQNFKLFLNRGKGLVDESGKLIFPYIKGAYRLTESDNYTDNFGKQWNEFKKTQIDKFSGSTHSKRRFFVETGWKKEEMSGQNVLEVGSGAGRFSQIVLDHTNANLYSLDFSNAVEANFHNNGPNNRLNLFQASIYDMPFSKESFDKVFCLGVLQHTPNVKESIKSLVEMVKPGGELVVDFYSIKGWWTKIHAKYMFRPFLKDMDHTQLLNWIKRNIDWMIAASRFFKKLGVSKFTNRFIPIVNLDTFPKDLTEEQIREWSILDTFDMFSPTYDQPQRLDVIRQYFIEFGMKNVVADFVAIDESNKAAVVKGTK